MLKISGYLIRASEPYRGHTESLLYIDDGVERVAFTGNAQVTSAGQVLQERTPDLTLAQYYEARGDDFKRITEAELRTLQAEFLQSMVTQPEPMTAERYDELLNCLPPCRWAGYGKASAFHILERLHGDLVQWCVQIKDAQGYRHFGFVDFSNVTPQHIIDKTKDL